MNNSRFKCITMMFMLLISSSLGVFAVVAPLDGAQRVGGDRQWSYVDEPVSIAGKSYQGWGCVTDGTLTHRMLGTAVFDVTGATRFTAYAGLRDNWIGDDGAVAIEVDGKLINRVARKSGDTAVFINLALKNAKRLAIRMAPSILLATPTLYDDRTLLKITTVPSGAELYLDGTKCGTSPMTVQVPDISDARKTVKLEARIAGFTTITDTVSLVPRRQNALSLELILLSTTLQITSTPPGATVLIDGREQEGTTPMNLTLNNVPGSHLTETLECRLPGLSSSIQLIRLMPEDQQLTIYLFRPKINLKDGAEMIFIPAGKFLMGNPFGNEQPAHEVTLSGYWIYKYEVTVAQYLVFCSATGHALPKFPSGYSWTGKTGWNDPALQQHPITNVSWSDATAYADWAGVQLPTEAQWEYAALGPQGRNYPWGGTATAADPNNGWDETKCANVRNSLYAKKSTWPVGSFPSGVSWCGAQDLAGNVYEWCADWYGTYSSSSVTNPPGPATGTYRVLRGGSWGDSDGFDDVVSYYYYYRGTYRNYIYPGNWYGDGGFRCASVSPGL